MGEVADTIHAKLMAGLAPEILEVVDDSASHAGHSGHRVGGESHFNVRIVSLAFQGLGRIDRNRLVNGLLADELAGPVHALSLKLQSPSEV
jgi:BolA protein